MDKSDACQFDYLDDNIHFADQVYGALFQGRQVVKPEELTPADTQTVYPGEETGIRKYYKTVADKVRLWRDRPIYILAVENQTFVGYLMVLRNMLLEALSYRKQWKQKKRDHEREKDLVTGTNAFLPEMAKEENRDIYSRIDSETRELIGVVGKVQLGEEYSILENGERKYDMCKAFMDMKLEGILEGKLEERREHPIRTVGKKLRKINLPRSLQRKE